MKPNATEADIERLCEEAKRYHFKMVAINSVQSERCAQYLADTDINVGAAISFPLGQTTIATKVFETQDALKHGAQEIDYVINITELKKENWDYITEEMKAVVEVCKDANICSKVIFENYFLTDAEKIRLCEIASEVGPNFIKTSTGFAPGGATVEDVKLMRSHVAEHVLVKAAGGIRTADDFLAMIAAGADRIGCSAGIKIIEELKARMRETGQTAIEIDCV